LKVELIGTTGGSEYRVNDITMPLEELVDIYYNSFKKVIEQDL